MHELSDIHVQVVKRQDRRYFTMRYVDPVTGETQSKSTKCTKRRDADRRAAEWEQQLRAGSASQTVHITWEDFRNRYESEKLAALSTHTLHASDSAFNHLERIINPQYLRAITPQILSKFQAALRKQGARETTIATHLNHLRASFSWAVSMGLLPKVPQIAMPHRARGRRLMRGRPLNEAEFSRMLAAVEAVRPHDAAAWRRYLEGLWLSGLRLQESLILSWDEGAPIAVDLSGRWPRLIIYAEAEKGHEDRLLPLTPDFAQFLLGTPDSDRRGAVFPLRGHWTGKPMTTKRISRVISAIGKQADVVVNPADGKFASAHDFRRSFGTRWASQVLPATLQLLMRHESIETTLKYYVSRDADAVAEELWALSGAPNVAP